MHKTGKLNLDKKKTTRLRVVRKLREHIRQNIRYVSRSRGSRGRGRERPRPEESRERAKDNGNSKEYQPKRKRHKQRKTSKESRKMRNKTRIARDSKTKKLDHRNLHQK
ncbi:MAG: hypothetical protein [Inoviridae sp.]|nr:MAG: hypothetical protein [Inoviridae sp.]